MEIIEVSMFSWILPGNSLIWRRPRRDMEEFSIDYIMDYEKTVVFCDVFESNDGDEVICVGPPVRNLDSFLKNCTFKMTGLNGSESVSISSIDALDRCARFHIPIKEKHDVLHIYEKNIGDINVPIGKNYSSLFKNKKVLITLNKNNDLKQITDWIKLNQELNGIDALLFLDNNSDAYSIGELVQYIAGHSNIDVLCVVNVPFKYGGSSIHSTPWDSDYLQYCILEIAHQRYLLDADVVFNCDIDEIFFSDDRRNVLSHIRHSGGVLSSESKNIYCPTNSPISQFLDVRNMDNSSFFYPPFIRADMYKNKKYAYEGKSVSKDDQLCVHWINFLDGKKMPEIEETVHYRHFIHASTGWGGRNSRWKQPSYAEGNYYLDCAFVKHMSKIKNQSLKYPLENVLDYARFVGACPRNSDVTIPEVSPDYDCTMCEYNPANLQKQRPTHISILAGCNVRDIFGICDKNNNYIVDSFIQHINPLSVVCETPLLKELNYSSDELRKYLKPDYNYLTDFDLRNAHIDLEKKTLNIIREKRSEYIFLDLTALKYGLCFFDAGFKTSLTKLHYDIFSSKIEGFLSHPTKEITINDWDEELLYKLLDKYMKLLLGIYDSNNIVFVEAYGVDKWADLEAGVLDENDNVHNSKWLMDKEDTRKANLITKKAFTYLHTKYPECHVIPFPLNVVGDVHHKWGKGNLHYIVDYYEYAYEAVNVIVANYPIKEETKIIKMLQDKYQRNCSVVPQIS